MGEELSPTVGTRDSLDELPKQLIVLCKLGKVCRRQIAVYKQIHHGVPDLGAPIPAFPWRPPRQPRIQELPSIIGEPILGKRLIEGIKAAHRQFGLAARPVAERSRQDKGL